MWASLQTLHQWLPGYAASVLRRPRDPGRPRHLLFCVADHFEPFGPRAFHGGRTADEARRLVARWREEYPRALGEFRDADGCPPRHTFFYPQEEYDATCLEGLAGLCAAGWGEVEIHLHHRNDTAAGLRQKLTHFRDVLRREHGLLGSDAAGRVRYGFVHGNWALSNSRPDGDWCGVNEELAVLAETGCYADFTFPSAPSPTQPRTVNALYRARDIPGRARGHDRGVQVGCGASRRGRLEGGTNRELRNAGMARGGEPSSGSLMLVQGPLALDWGRRKWGLVPRIENAELGARGLPSPGRVRLWVRQGIHVRGRPDWIFVKVHTHGCAGTNADVLLGGAMMDLHRFLQAAYNDGNRWRLHYVSTRETYNIIRAAETGASGDPARHRDGEIGRPPVRA
jgi:hypothetical protein